VIPPAAPDPQSWPLEAAQSGRVGITGGGGGGRGVIAHAMMTTPTKSGVHAADMTDSAKRGPEGQDRPLVSSRLDA
jgi:hypothetical protein